ncbi:MAG: hypothetical protein IPO16_02650 [Saprospiraceae bacterium]|nr:hypothetical protein [Saprospiraceae bacterium]
MHILLKSILFTILIIIVILMLFIKFYFSLDLDEDKIIKESNEAFKKQRYRIEVFEKSNKIYEFAKFLIRNSDSLIYYNQSDTFIDFKLTGGGSQFFNKKGECFSFITTNDKFIEYYIPKYLIDSFNHYITLIDSKFISRFELCTKIGSPSIDRNFGTISFNLNCKPDDPLTSDYYLQHSVVYNYSSQPQSLVINKIEQTLQKDTLIVDGLRYMIRVLPYAGI